MRADTDISREPGGTTSAELAARLGKAVGNGTNGKSRGNGNGAIEAPGARDVALDVCRAILAEAGAGTAEHSDDVVLITEAIGDRLGFTGDAADDLLIAAQLHDIGKAWVPSRILEKPGPLTDEEWALMRRHTVIGEEILSAVEELARSVISFATRTSAGTATAIRTGSRATTSHLGAGSSSALTPSTRSGAIAPTGPVARRPRRSPRSGAAPAPSSIRRSPARSSRSCASVVRGRPANAHPGCSPSSCVWS